ncbi:YfjI family protein [Ramlibacter sp. Leaf400]|uniref:YfjI family protein n=1 Tax=Ramlibacter sp. Leaf400 TaxID=1736365 RepID=UPI000A69B67B|nr:YfjI family protein [Ramlibacter sp. Leaf400]
MIEHEYGEASLAAVPEAQEIRRAIDLLWGNRSRFELRLLHKRQGRTFVDAGLFDRAHLGEMIALALERNAGGRAVYVNLNPIRNDHNHAAVNQLERSPTGLVGNSSIEKREFFPIDLDPARPADTSATDAQLREAEELGKTIKAYLSARGWPDPIECASGNGVHLLYSIDLPNDDESRRLVEAGLHSLDVKFSTGSVKIDKSMGNAGRIIKLYGTVANKGADTPATPHRRARVLRVPEQSRVVPSEALMQLAGPSSRPWPLGPMPTWLQNGEARSMAAGAGFDLDAFMAKLGIPFTLERKTDGNEWLHLDRCPFDPAHGPKKSAVYRGQEGRLGFKCFHDSCTGRDWHALRDLVENQSAPPTASPPAGPQKLPPALKPVPHLSADLLPRAIAPAVVDAAERLQCPADYLAVSMLTAAGAIVGNRLGIWPMAKDETWTVFPALWGAIVGDPGTKKTPAMQVAHVPLRHLEERAREKFGLEYKLYKAEKAQYDKAFEAWKKDKAGEAPVGPPPEPKLQRIVVHDTTYQALGQILADNPRGVLALADELSGLLRGLDAPGQEAARGFFLTGWGGNSGYSFDRIGRGAIVLPRYSLTMFGGFQPELMKSYVREAQRGEKSDGLLQRFQLLVWPDCTGEFQLVDRSPDAQAMGNYHRAMDDLHRATGNTMHVNGEAGDQPTMVHFAGDAQQTFNVWYLANEKLVKSGRLDSSRQSHFAKYRSLVPALALLFHLLDCQPGKVCRCCTERAIGFASYLKAHAHRVYGSMYGHDYGAARVLAEKLLNGAIATGFSRRTLKQKCWSGLGRDEQMQAALDALVELGWLIEHDDRKPGGGRPTTRYLIAAGISADLL